MDLPLLKNDIPNNLEPQKPVIYSSYAIQYNVIDVGVSAKTETCLIRVLSITDLEFVPFTDIILRSRIFRWYRPGDR
jgi:hypothetical protein